MKPIRLALVGAGAMAARHAQVIARSTEVSLRVVVDRDPDRAAALAVRYGATAAIDLQETFGCDAAVVASATQAHSQAALALIDAGLHVLVEKPLTGSLDETRNVIDAATAGDLVLMCGLVERFNPAFVDVRTRVAQRATHVDATRISPPPPRVHSSVVDDLLLHDLDLVLALAGDDPLVDLQAQGSDRVRCADWPETVTCRLAFESGLTASLYASRVAPSRRRSLAIFHAGHVEHIDLLEVRGDPLGAQLERFVSLIRDGTALDRERERMSVLPSHAVAHRVQQYIAETPCSLQRLSGGPADT